MKDEILQKITMNNKILKRQIKYLELFNERKEIYQKTLEKINT